MTRAKANATFFFDEQFTLSREDRERLGHLKLSPEAIDGIEGLIQQLRGFYAMPQLTRGERIARVRGLLEPLEAISRALARLDDQTAGLLRAQARIPMEKFREFCEDVEHLQAAGRFLSDRHDGRGQSADKGNHIAIEIGRALDEFGFELDYKVNGIFVGVLQIAFSSLNLAKAEPRNEARRALKHLHRGLR
jgi:hypothetical protein